MTVTGTHTRYPGAHPFSDDAVSRSVFFGREAESAALADQIGASRLVVVYAKSGLGKTSLLHAGVSQPLRDDNFLPLIVRVNDVKQGPIASLLEGVRASAERQGVEYHPGSQLSLWHFFKTAEFWRGDLLLTPVLILDQFEELFTLQGPEARAKFLAELGYLVRGVEPVVTPGPAGEPEQGGMPERQLTDTPPAMRVLISLREDFLGSLEEAADDIPQILDHRFRLTPLDMDAAAAAMAGPAQVRDKRLATPPFSYHQDAQKAILNYLSRHSRGRTNRASHGIEPFQLQLICQRVETLVAERQGRSDGSIEITLSDLGGEDGLKGTLRDFYREVVHSIEPRRTQKAVRRLCEQYLISPEGRRLSLDEAEIKRILKLKSDTLGQLVNRRLLRADQRADSWYYELSHDSLIEPVVARTKVRGIVLGVSGLIGSAIAGFVAIILFIAMGVAMVEAMHSPQTHGPAAKDAPGPIVTAIVISIFTILVVVPLSWASIAGARRSVEIFKRSNAPSPVSVRDADEPVRQRTIWIWVILVYSICIAVMGIISAVEFPFSDLAGGLRRSGLGKAFTAIGLLTVPLFLAAGVVLFRLRALAVKLYLIYFCLAVPISACSGLHIDYSGLHMHVQPPTATYWIDVAFEILIDGAILLYAWRLRRRGVLV